MKRRLRKKLHKNEFAEYGYPISFLLPSEETFYDVFDFILDHIRPDLPISLGGGATVEQHATPCFFLVIETSSHPLGLYQQHLETLIDSLTQHYPELRPRLSNKFDLYYSTPSPVFPV